MSLGSNQNELTFRFTLNFKTEAGITGGNRVHLALNLRRFLYAFLQPYLPIAVGIRQLLTTLG